MGARTDCGYGNVSVGGKTLLAHRVAWIARHGAIAEGLCVCHHCDVRNCINPDHLFLATHKGNMVDLKKKMGLRARQPVRQSLGLRSGLLRLEFNGQEVVSRVLSVRSITAPADPEELSKKFPEDSPPTAS